MRNNSLEYNYNLPFISEEDEPEEEKSAPGNMWSKKTEELFFQNRAVYLWGVVEDKSAKDIVNKLLLLDSDDHSKEIKFYINSPGGVVTSGMVMYDVIKMIQAPVTTICMGLAASMGSVLLSAGRKGKRFIFPHGQVMIHQPSLGGYFQGVAADLEIQAIQIQKTKDLIGKIIAESSGQKLEKVMLDLERDHWLDAQEALDYGMVDAIVDKI